MKYLSRGTAHGGAVIPKTMRPSASPETPRRNVLWLFRVVPKCGGGRRGKCKVYICGVRPVVHEPSARTRRDQRQMSDATVVLHFEFSQHHSLTLISKVRGVDPSWSARIRPPKNMESRKNLFWSTCDVENFHLDRKKQQHDGQYVMLFSRRGPGLSSHYKVIGDTFLILNKK